MYKIGQYNVSNSNQELENC